MASEPQRLAAALETFRRLGAEPWTRRAEAELRACGVTAAAPTAPGALAGLTTQQREIILLASRGLTNAEIADRLFLSPRTVASHLQGFHKAIQAVGHRLRVVESAMRHMSESLAAAEKQSKVRGAAAPKPRRSLGGSRREKRAGAASNLRAL